MGGAVAAVPRILGELAGILRDRFRERRRSALDGIPPDLDAIDADWLGRALRLQFPGVRLRAIELMGHHTGTTTRARLALVSEVAGRPAGIPDSVFVKLTPPDIPTRLFGNVFGLAATEVRFYRELRDSVPVRTPRVYCAQLSRSGGRFVLVLEDLVASGCRFATLESELGLEEARAVVAALGRLHAAFWGTRRFEGDLSWLCRETRGNAGFERWLAERANPVALRRFGHRVSESARTQSRRIHRVRERLDTIWAEAPGTLIHGDPHAGNLYLLEGEVGFFDWQVTQRGQGIRDVGYFLINSLSTKLRRAHQRELIEFYGATLADSGVRGLDVGRLWERYRLVAPYVWIAAAVTAAAGRLQVESIAGLGIERSGAALDDLEPLDLLR